jgi:FtsH-binding integral membrane protein
MRHLKGYILIAVPFVAIFWVVAAHQGVRAALIAFAYAALAGAILASVIAGVLILTDWL